MITQNLFNTRPKTFMDYEPGKIPKKEEWGKQSIMQTIPKNAFESNVKIVGDDITEKDYDTFFEGFNSVNIMPLQKETRSVQKPAMRDALYRPSVDGEAKIQTLPYIPSVHGEPTIQKLPYIPSVHGEPKIQKFSYSPSENGEANISLYSATTPTHIQVKNVSQNAGETVWDRIKDYGEDLLPYATPAITLGKALEDHVKEKHYERNQYNVDLPATADEAKGMGWKPVVANCHQFTAPDEEEHKHIKYVSPDGKREVMFDYTGTKVINADEDVGTYNYADPNWWLEHFVVDVLPWIVYGNTPEDSTEWYERVGGFLGFEN